MQMNICEIAIKSKGKDGFRFRKVGSSDTLIFLPSGYPAYINSQGFAEVKNFHLDQDSLIAEYEIVCDHEVKWLVLKGETPAQGGLCRWCGRDIVLFAKDITPAAPIIPERPSTVTAHGLANSSDREKEAFLKKYMEDIRKTSAQP
jgi:hypothetical protein